MKRYEIGFVFFVALDDEDSARKDALLDELDLIDEIDSYDVTRDDEDWNIECTATLSAKSVNDADKRLTKLLYDLPYTWDYHYIKGIDNTDYYQP